MSVEGSLWHGPVVPISWCSCLMWSPPLEGVLDLVIFFKQTEYSQRNMPSLPLLANKRLWLLSCWYYIFSSRSSHLLIVMEAPQGKELRAASGQHPLRSWGLQPNSPQRTESCQQPPSELGRWSCPSWTWSWTLQPLPIPWLQPCKRACGRGPSWVMLRFLTHTTCDIIHVCCFMPIILEIIRYTAIDK